MARGSRPRTASSTIPGPSLALQQRKRFRKDTALIVEGTLLPTRGHTIAAQSKRYRYSTNHRVVTDADTRLAVAVGRPVTGNRNDGKAWEISGTKDAVGKTTVIADGGEVPFGASQAGEPSRSQHWRATGLVVPHRRERSQAGLPDWKEAHNRSHRRVRARVEHALARMKTWQILRARRPKGDGVHPAMLGITRLHNLTLAG